MTKRTLIRGAGEAMLPLVEIRKRLVAQRRALFEQVAEVEDDIRWLDANLEPESVEEGQEGNLARLLARLDERGKAEIAAIDSALIRIVRGEYGRCASCGKPIAAPRLEALPAVADCLPCARAKELVR